MYVYLVVVVSGIVGLVKADRVYSTLQHSNSEMVVEVVVVAATVEH